MRIKKYLVKDIKDALIQIKQELGENAVILQTRKIRKGGFLGIFGGEIFTEVTAVAEEEPASVDSQKRNLEDRETHHDTIYNLREILSQNIRKESNTSTEKNEIRTDDTSSKKEFKDSFEILKDMEEIKKMFNQLNMKIELLNGELREFPVKLRHLFRKMLEQSVDEPLALQIISEMKNIDFLENSELMETLAKKISGLIKVEIPSISNGISIFLGPTGVGKTTTLAKLAANLRLKQQKEVAILTIDTFRIAAVSQLKTYAEIMDIPFFVAYTPQEAKNIITTIGNFDSILIDTAGRSQKDEIHLDELKKYIETINPNYRFLLLNVAINFRDLMEIVERFSICNPTHIIFTKLDETNTFGNILNVENAFELPVAFVTTGQNVPEDIEKAEPRKLSELILKEVFKDV